MTQDERFSEIWNTEDLVEQLALTKTYLVEYPNVNELIGKFWKNSLLHVACYRDNLEMVEYLLDFGADINVNEKGRNALHAALGNSNKLNNQLKIIQLLTKRGITILDGLNDGSCFLMALQCCKLDIVQYLNEHYPESCTKSFAFEAQGLHEACENDDPSILAYCLQFDQDVNKVDENGETPVIRTCGEKEFVEQLIAYGADINARDKYGQTVLHNCVYVEIQAIMDADEVLDTSNTEFLLRNGADKSLMDNNGETALDWALSHGEGIYRTIFDKY